MKKLIPIVCLALLPFASACPVKKGYLANGLIKNTYSTEVLAPVCGEMRDYVAQNVFKTMKWTELHGVKNTNGGLLQVAVIQKILTHNGFKETAAVPTEKGKMWRFDKGGKIIMMMTAVNDPIVFVAISGN